MADFTASTQAILGFLVALFVDKLIPAQGFRQLMGWTLALAMAVMTFILLVTHDTQGEIIFCCITPHNKTHIQAIRPGLGASVLFLRSVTVGSGRMVPKNVLSIQFFRDTYPFYGYKLYVIILYYIYHYCPDKIRNM